jgi:hypothetical protein
MNNQQKLNLIWRKTPAEYKSTRGGFRSLLVLREGGTWLVPLSDLTETEIDRMVGFEKRAA